MNELDRNQNNVPSPREKLLSLSLESTRKSYYPQLQRQLKTARESEGRLKLLINNLPARLSYVNSREQYLLVNKEYENAFGLSQEEILGKHMETVVGKENYSKLKPYIQQVLEGQHVQFEIKLVNANHNEQWVDLNFVPDINAKRGVQGFYVLAIDLTEKKQAEKEKRSLERKLRQAQKMESLGTLAGGIAHDFNNILSPLLGYAELLKEDLAEDDPRQEHVAVILRATYRARDIVKQILTFSRHVESEIKPVRLQSTIKEALKLLRSSIPTSIQFKTSIDPACGIVIADPTQIHQIIMNLATNAFHAMERDGGALTITLNQVSLTGEEIEFSRLEEGIYAALTIADTGVGIEPDVLEKVFDPYFSTKSKGKGTGLGLAVVQGIVQSCQGDIRIDSLPGQGTRVSVLLPVKSIDTKEYDDPIKSPIPGGSERILLVDDDEIVLKYQHKVLYRLGYRVTAMMNSLKALERFQNNAEKFDLIITDMSMPGLTGMQFINKVRKIRPGIPIIVCTGFSEQINAKKCQTLGIQDYIMKPANNRELAESIRRVLS